MPHKKKADSTKKMFRDPSGQQDFIEQSYEEELEAKRNQPVECLGIKFPNDDARREYFLSELAKKLKDPGFRKTEGFPIGEDEDILALSDPPYYTACPNPWIGHFVNKHGCNFVSGSDSYHSEPFATDVSEGKTGAIYNAHSYHTKVPYLAIQKYIAHYTKPGDLVLDGFSGTGMTGVATIAAGKSRACILTDLCPAASFISHLYNSHVDANLFRREAEKLLRQLEADIGDIYAVLHRDNGETGIIESVIWSAVMICPSCNQEVPFWNLQEADVPRSVICPSCSAVVKRTDLSYVTETFLDPVAQSVRKKNKKTPVSITYRADGKRFTREATDADVKTLTSDWELPGTWFPTEPMLGIGTKWGDTYRAGYHCGYEYAYDFYFPRTLQVLSRLRSQALEAPRTLRTHLLSLLTSVAFAATHLYKYRTKGGGQPSGNNLYVPALIKEQNVFAAIRRKLDALVDAEQAKRTWKTRNLVSTESSTHLARVS